MNLTVAVFFFTFTGVPDRTIRFNIIRSGLTLAKEPKHAISRVLAKDDVTPARIAMTGAGP